MSPLTIAELAELAWAMSTEGSPTPSRVDLARLPHGVLELYETLLERLGEEQGTVTNAELCEALGWGRSRVVDRLNDLVDCGALERSIEAGMPPRRVLLLRRLDLRMVQIFQNVRRCVECGRLCVSRPGGFSSGKFCPRHKQKRRRDIGWIDTAKKRAALLTKGRRPRLLRAQELYTMSEQLRAPVFTRPGEGGKDQAKPSLISVLQPLGYLDDSWLERDRHFRKSVEGFD